jgi:hypothetical protein
MLGGPTSSLISLRMSSISCTDLALHSADLSNHPTRLMRRSRKSKLKSADRDPRRPDRHDQPVPSESGFIKWPPFFSVMPKQAFCNYRFGILPMKGNCFFSMNNYTKALFVAAVVSAGFIGSASAQTANPNMAAWDQAFRGAAENMSDAADQQRERLQQQKEERAEREARQKWEQQQDQKVRELYKTNPEYRSQADQGRESLQAAQEALEGKGSISQKLHNEIIQRQQELEREQEEQEPNVHRADGPYYDKDGHYMHYPQN